MQAEDSGEVRGSQGVKSWSFDFNSWAVGIPCRFQKLRGGFWETDSGGWWEGKEKSRLVGLALVQVELRLSGWGVKGLVGPSSELGSPGGRTGGETGGIQLAMPAHPPRHGPDCVEHTGGRFHTDIYNPIL